MTFNASIRVVGSQQPIIEYQFRRDFQPSQFKIQNAIQPFLVGMLLNRAVIIKSIQSKDNLIHSSNHQIIDEFPSQQRVNSPFNVLDQSEKNWWMDYIIIIINTYFGSPPPIASSTSCIRPRRVIQDHTESDGVEQRGNHQLFEHQQRPRGGRWRVHVSQQEQGRSGGPFLPSQRLR